MASVGKRTLLREVNPHLICPLCRGYLIDATTVVECLHSFCRSCILKHLSKAAHCPSCKHVLNKAKPNIKADKALQDIVYKLVPGLYHKEMRKRREFYKKHPEHADSATPEQRGEDVSGRLIFAPEDAVSLSLEYLPPGADPWTILSTNDTDANHPNGVNGNSNTNNHNNNNTVSNRRYLQCPALVTIAHLKKFLALKYSVDMTRYSIEICHRRAPLPEHWTLMDVAYIYAWKRIAPMRFFYRVAQEEQRLEAPLHQRPSTPGLGACLPPSDAIVNTDNNGTKDAVNNPKVPKLENKPTNNNGISMAKDSIKIPNDKICLPKDNKQITTDATNETNKTMPLSVAMATTSSSPLTTINSPILTVATATNVSPSTCDDTNNKQIKSPIKIMKNSDGKYEVLRGSPANWNGKEQAAIPVTDIKPTNPEFSVVSIGNGQNSNGVKITLKQCSPTSGTNSKKPKVISNVLLRCGQVEKDPSGALVIQQLQKDKDIILSPPTPDKQQEKQRRKVTFVDRPMTEKTSPPSGTIMPKTVLKKPAEQQDKKQFLQGFQLTAKESVPDNTTLKSPIRDFGVTSEISSIQKKENTSPKVEEFSTKKDAMINTDQYEIREKTDIENTSLSNSNNIATSTIAKRFIGTPVNNARIYANKGSADANRRASFSSDISLGTNANQSSSHSGARIDVYTFHSSDPPIVPAGAVKRKCPPGVPIADLKRKRQQIQTQNQGTKKRTVSPPNPSPTKLPRTSSTEHLVPSSRAIGVAGEHGGLNRMSNTKTSTSPMLSSDTRNLLDGCGLSIPASLSITLTAPKSPGTSGQFIESNDPTDIRKTATLGKVNPSITLNDRSVDPRVLKALKTGQIKMPAPPKTKLSATSKQIDRNEMNQQQRTTSTNKRKKEQDSILDLSGGKKMDIHPLRIPQPVTKLKTNNKTASRDGGMPGISDQGQVVTLMGGHRYYRAPPGSLTPAVHRVNDCSPLPTPSRTPVYAPTLADVSRTGPNLSSVFPSLQSLYALSQAPNLQQFHMDARLRLPPPRATESIASAGSSENVTNSSSINGVPNKSHLAAQCAPVKPARSSVAPLAVPINKQQQSTDKSANASIKRTISSDTDKLPVFSNNESLIFTDENAPRLIVQTRYSSGIENTNKFLSSRSNTDGHTKSSDQTIIENSRNSNTKPKNESVDADNSMQQQQHNDTASPRVSSTASPSPPPGSSNTRNENGVNHDNNVNNASNKDGGSNATANTILSSPTKNNVITEVTSTKSPASPDSSSIAVENPTDKSHTPSIETLTEGQISEATKTTDSVVNPNDNNTIDNSIASVDDKNKFVNQPVDAKQLTSEMVQKRLLAVFPSNEWANNPIAAEHLGNFLKSLNATMKSDGHAEESKEEIDRKSTTNNDGTRIGGDASVKSKNDIVERS